MLLVLSAERSHSKANNEHTIDVQFRDGVRLNLFQSQRAKLFRFIVHYARFSDHRITQENDAGILHAHSDALSTLLYEDRGAEL